MIDPDDPEFAEAAAAALSEAFGQCLRLEKADERGDEAEIKKAESEAPPWARRWLADR